MEHKLFSRGMKILIAGTLVITALRFPDWILIGFTAGWLVVMAVLLMKKSGKSSEEMNAPPKKAKPDEDHPEPDNVPDNPDTHPDEDAETWYRMIGKAILTDAVTDLNTHGSKQLTIRENGDILIEDSVYDTFDSFPKQSLWNRLTELMKEDGLNAFTANNEISVSW